MIKRLALLCCILLLPTSAAAASPEGTTNYGDFWAAGQVGAIFTADRDVTRTTPRFRQRTNNIATDVGVTAGTIIGYNFCMPYRQAWERYFGVALDFSWNQFNQTFERFPNVNGDQFAISFLARAQYPFMGNETFTRGRLVPFIMLGPAIVWTNSDFSNFGGSSSKTSTDIGIVAEVGLEYFVVPQMSIGPSFRYRHVFGPGFEFQRLGNRFKLDSDVDQFTLMARLAYHF